MYIYAPVAILAQTMHWSLRTLGTNCSVGCMLKDGCELVAKPTKELVSLVVVHAADQPWNEAPTKAALHMIPMLRDLRDESSAIFPACLHS